MTVPLEILRAIGEAVRDAGGDMDDVDDLVAVWKRLCADGHGRADRMRREAQTIRCCCADGGVASADRCSRCWGWIPEVAR